MPFLLIFIFVAGWLNNNADAAEPLAEKSVTTTWLKDPFSNVAPKAYDQRVVVEANVPERTPSALCGAYDVEADALSVKSFTKPAHGTAVLNKDGTFTYAPNKDYVGDDRFDFTISDGRGGTGKATIFLDVVRTTGKWSATSFTDLAETEVQGKPIQFDNAATCPRVCDWDGDGKLEVLVGVQGGVWLYRNTGTPKSPKFAQGVRVQSGGRDIRFGNGRVSIASIDMNRDGKPDLVVIPESDRKVRLYRNTAKGKGEPVLAEAEILKSAAGGDLVAADIRAEVADWNGDGLPDLITGARSGAVQVAYNVGAGEAPAFSEPVKELDGNALAIDGSYNINVRIADINQDGVPDLVDSYNWGNVNFRINAGTVDKPKLPETGTLGISGPNGAAVDIKAVTDGAILDFGDFNGDGTLDAVLGGEVGGKVRMAYGLSGEAYLQQIEAMVAAHPKDLAAWLADPANAAEKSRMQTLQGALYDYIIHFATPGQRNRVGRALLQLVTGYPQYFRLQEFDVKQQPGMPSLAVQTWLSLMMVRYGDPAARKALCDAAGFTDGYRKLVEDFGLIYADNRQNPRGAEAIHQWMRTIPREVYPGTCITANDWLGGRVFLVRGHTKNTFNGQPIDGGEYGFGSDARKIIGDRGSENWFMTVVRHEACHDMDAYVRQRPDMNRRWGQMLVMAGGPEMRADAKTGWFSWDLTKKHFRETGLWNGEAADWDAAWKNYWSKEPGSGWREFGFMRGNIPWFLDAAQESLATQGNQFWNSTEGRLQVAIHRFRRGYNSNLTEVLLFMDIWSVGLDKIKFCECDNACNQVLGFAKLGRTPEGYINRIDLGDRAYEFRVDKRGVATEIVRGPDGVSQ